MTDIQEKKLLEIVDKTIKYEKKIYDVQSFKENARNLVVFTKQRSFVLSAHQVDEFLDAISIVPNTEPYVPNLPQTKTKETNKVNLQIYEPTDSQKAVQSSLLDMLEKVKEDPKAIPQAKAVCEIANTMVSMEKAQIQLMQLAQRRN
ncbi:hypothetical protein [Bizionia sp.]|uniref:hypothetical protein n=1 Tax=Bizionia sp. TaxID=1954480 RepID=UPI003A91F53D